MYAVFYLGHLKGSKQHKTEIQGKCPFHKDDKPSFSANIETGQYYCHACGEKGNAFTFAQKRNIPLNTVPGSNPKFSRKSSSEKQKRRIVKTYDYVNENCRLLFQVCRYEPKDFRQRTPKSGGGWKYELGDVRRVLYNLPNVVKAFKVIIVEGEKDADRLNALGYTATTCPMGSKKWRPEYNVSLKDKDVTLIPDNDEPGRAHAQDVKKQLEYVARSFRTIPLPKTMPEGTDISDFLDRYGAKNFAILFNSPIPETFVEYLELCDKQLKDMPFTDKGNAQAICKLHGDNIRYDHTAEKWLIWDGNHWQTDNDMAIKRIVLVTIQARRLEADKLKKPTKEKLIMWCKKSESNPRINAAIDLAKSMLPIATNSEKFDQQSFLLGCANGVVDLKTGNLLPGKPDQLLSLSTNVLYDLKANCPRWIQFVDEIFSSDAEMINFFQLAVGYSLTADTREQCFFILHGRGANGKSTCLDILHELLGEYADVTPSATFVSSRYDSARIPSDIAALYKKRFVIASEIKEKAYLNEERLKSLTGDEPIKARFMHKDYFKFTPTFKIWFAVNHKPNITDLTEGFWRRVRLIPFERQFPPELRDDALKEKLRAELPGILNWAIAGCLAWQKEGLKPPQKIIQASAEYRRESDVLRNFISECCIESEENRVSASQLFEAYKNWAETNNEPQPSQTKFGIKMTEAGYTKQKCGTNRRWHYIGIGLVEDRE